MEFGCKVAGAKVVLVMGHTACGAIKGAIDKVQLGNLTGLLAKTRPAVDATIYTGERTSKNYGFVDAVARKNVEMTVAQVREKSPGLRELEASHAIKITGSMCNLETATVEFFSWRKPLGKSRDSAPRFAQGISSGRKGGGMAPAKKKGKVTVVKLKDLKPTKDPKGGFLPKAAPKKKK